MNVSRRSFVTGLLCADAPRLRADKKSPTVGEAWSRLKVVDTFAFGGVGYAGVTTDGEPWYKLILAQPREKAVGLFEPLYSEGYAEAKCYALAGLHALAPERFEDLRLNLPNASVWTMVGCIGQRLPIAQIAKNIAEGHYAKWADPQTAAH